MRRIGFLPTRESARVASGDPAWRVVLDLWIDRTSAHMLRDNTQFFVHQVSPFSEPSLEAVLPPEAEPGAPLADGASVRGIDPPRLDQLLQDAYQNLKVVTELLRDGIPEIRDLAVAVEELSRLTVQIEPQPGILTRTLQRGSHLVDQLAALLADLDRQGLTTARLRRVADRLGELLTRAQGQVASIRSKLDVILPRLEKLAEVEAEKRLAELRVIATRATDLLARTDDLLRRAQRMMDMFRQGEGTLAALFQDESLVDDVKDILRALKQTPWVTLGPRDGTSAR